jgi:hypothetical protein
MEQGKRKLKLQNTLMTRPERWMLAGIVLIAALLRAQNLLEIEHNVDHAYPIWQALTTLEHGIFPLAGQGTSVLFANPALTGYLFLPLIALVRSPLAAYLLVITLNTVGVYLGFRVSRGLLGVRPALVAAFLLAVNPWMIEYSRTAWVQSLLPFFAPALAWLLWPVLMNQTRHPVRRTISAFVLLTLYTQTYLLAFMALAPVGLLILIFWRRVPKKGLYIGGAIFILAGLLYGVGLADQLSTVQERLAEFSANPRHLSGEAWGHAVRLVTGEDYALVRGQSAPIPDAPLRHDLTRIAHLILTAALLLGLLLAAIQVLRQIPFFKTGNWQLATGNFFSHPSYLIPHTFSVILLLWFLIPIALMTNVGQPVHPFYQLIGLPAGHSLAAWGLCAVFRPQSRWGSRALLVLSIPFAFVMSVNTIRFAEETAVTPGIDGMTALPLEYGLPLGRAISDNLPPGGVVFSDADEWILNSFAGRTFPVIHDARAPRIQIISPAGALYVQIAYDSVDALPYANRVATIRMPDLWTLTVDRYAPDTLPEIGQPMHVASQQGIACLGYNIAQDIQTIRLTTFWQVETLTPGIENSLFAPFIHVFDKGGNRVQIVDGELLGGDKWHAGDIHVHRLTITLPDSGAPFSLQIGQYDSVHSQNVIFLPDYTPTIPLKSP